jgi:uncharacterized surface protein with fasciclin (FAS1) repeats
VKKKTIILIVVAVLVIAGGVAAYWFFVLNSSNSDDKTQMTTQSEASKPVSDKDVATLIADTGNLSNFNDALKAANLTTTLTGVGPYTVLAPSNNAFNALPSGTLDRLLKPENAQSLSSILSYHIAAGSLLTSQLTNGQKVKTTNGQEVIVSVDGTNVYFIDAKGNKALVTKSDIKAKNGVIHIIDAVLLPQ